MCAKANKREPKYIHGTEQIWNMNVERLQMCAKASKNVEN